MANVYILGDVTAACRLALDCYNTLDRHKPDYEYRQFQESIEKARFDLQKLEIELLSNMNHAHFGSVSDDFASVWQTLSDSLAPSSASTSTSNSEIEDPYAFEWPGIVGCTSCNNDHSRDGHGYVDRHALKFNNDPFHRPGLAVDTDLETDLDKMDRTKGGTALWPTSANMTTTSINCHRDDNDDDIDDRLV
ncbi:hypothetical protein Sste5346_006929 [Sporothrix stenoceras]|uniref:Uncharacterized protein n=1 Tax=Sporothrix stenoceras TaxID=5173 RepID=A0ABR3YW78_9PEZI